MNIIIEGVDRSGKSTLCKWLIDKYNLKYQHFTIPKSKHDEHDIILDPKVRPFKQFLDYADKFVESTDDLLIDRFVYSNYVYGPVYKTFIDHVSIEEINCIEKILQPKNTCIIHCELEDVQRNWELIVEEGENRITESTLLFFRSRYNKLLEHTTLPLFKYDYTKPNSLNELEEFINKINTNKEK